jgi:acyl-CoA thioesterase-1
VIIVAFQGASSHADQGFLIKNSVLVLGDSLSSGLGIEPDQGWVSQLKHRLSSPYFGLKVVNASISGETTQGGLNRIGGLLDKYTPLIVILELGGNDGLRGLPLSLMKDNLDRMITLALDRKVKVVLIGMKIPTNYGKFYTKQFANIYASLATKHKIPLVPFLLDGIASHPEMMQDDGIHPRANAQRQMLDNVWPSLKKALPKPHLSLYGQRQFQEIAEQSL